MRRRRVNGEITGLGGLGDASGHGQEPFLSNEQKRVESRDIVVILCAAGEIERTLSYSAIEQLIKDWQGDPEKPDEPRPEYGRYAVYDPDGSLTIRLADVVGIEWRNKKRKKE